MFEDFETPGERGFCGIGEEGRFPHIGPSDGNDTRVSAHDCISDGGDQRIPQQLRRTTVSLEDPIEIVRSAANAQLFVVSDRDGI